MICLSIAKLHRKLKYFQNISQVTIFDIGLEKTTNARILPKVEVTGKVTNLNDVNIPTLNVLYGPKLHLLTMRF
jgi:hypothetical protein